ncbi:hypothetical protein GGS23DRAFT_598243 [Durotheca rogersii]|uniref:uncharacterized protein n=1 Tax=Durotheca rogersii TaxID=419775 RepID=UPI0022212A6D|nr:uncharacterized protein GGS23DRAFT_598243 [Durotheca rogersii]KAI5861849.1 hypothetical protein GGS23DRAFT_598243 [Durotheca rogersii]
MATDASGPSPPTPLLRLRGLRTAQLPAAGTQGAELAPLLAAAVREAAPFIDSAAPKRGARGPETRALWRKKPGAGGARGAEHRFLRFHPDSAAGVEVSVRAVGAAELGGGGGGEGGAHETWVCRRSVHEDAARPGTASWGEFARGLRDEHAASERAFTPACVGARRALAWDCAGVRVAETGPTTTTTTTTTWGRFTLELLEMRHRVGRPVLRDRTFPVLQMTCVALAGGGEEAEARGDDEFLVVSIPVPDFGAASPASELARERGAQVARYVSVERVRRIRGGAGGEGAEGAGGGARIEWLMATAGDAGGVLPAWLQSMATPAVIWKDVPLFLAWVRREREKKEDGAQGEEEGGREVRGQEGVGAA